MEPSHEPVRSWEALLVTVALGVISLYMFDWAITAAVHSRKTETVPDLKGRSLSAALDMLSPLDLGLRKESEEFDSSVPIGSVLRQEPPAGAVVREGKVVKIVISQGGQTELAPNLEGLPLRNAEMLLRQNQLNLGEVSENYSLRMEKGMVLSQEPKEESSVERNSLINISISAGSPPSGVRLMPDFERKSIGPARSWATDAGISIQETKDPGSLFPYGVILSQTPAPDTVLADDTSVAFVISGKFSQGQEGAAAKTFHYQVSQGGTESLVRIVVVDKYGEHEIFNGLRQPGSKLDIPVEESDGARVKIFSNGILVEERDL